MAPIKPGNSGFFIAYRLSSKVEQKGVGLLIYENYPTREQKRTDKLTPDPSLFNFRVLSQDVGKICDKTLCQGLKAHLLYKMGTLLVLNYLDSLCCVKVIDFFRNFTATQLKN
ncbi:hypothetical protein [Methylomonas sp. AM2-LC]|uniref:hypothetical protein n=1 Tax=Methylomonas sp. AM2-LC TaxID=3153301 RepID=UPI003263EDC3